jgi:hypothetical protein
MTALCFSIEYVFKFLLRTRERRGHLSYAGYGSRVSAGSNIASAVIGKICLSCHVYVLFNNMKELFAVSNDTAHLLVILNVLKY